MLKAGYGQSKNCVTFWGDMSKPFYEQPVLNSPYFAPTRHHALGRTGSPLTILRSRADANVVRCAAAEARKRRQLSRKRDG
jgi:hypothetical protein